MDEIIVDKAHQMKIKFHDASEISKAQHVMEMMG
jgi:hypothetical protein